MDRRSSVSSKEDQTEEYKPIITGVTCQGQPNVHYDLLSKEEKSPSFQIRFETANPQPRFVIQCRMMCRHLGELRLVDVEELIRVSLTFADHHEIYDASITIPAAKYDRNDLQQEIFFAYMEVPYVENFLKVYRIYRSEIPQWPSPVWVCSHWPVKVMKETVDTQYVKAVKRGSPKLTVQSNLLARRYQRPASDTRRLRDFRRTSTLPQDIQSLQVQEWILVVHPTQSLVGLARKHSRDDPWTVTDRAQALNKMQELSEKYCRHRGCFFCLSLVGPYRFGSGVYRNVIGFIAFPTGVPERLKAKCAQPPPTRRLSQVEKDDVPADLETRYVDEVDLTTPVPETVPTRPWISPCFFEQCVCCLFPRTSDD